MNVSDYDSSGVVYGLCGYVIRGLQIKLAHKLKTENNPVSGIAIL